jgi:hypothetical protein
MSFGKRAAPSQKGPAPKRAHVEKPAAPQKRRSVPVTSSRFDAEKESDDSDEFEDEGGDAFDNEEGDEEEEEEDEDGGGDEDEMQTDSVPVKAKDPLGMLIRALRLSEYLNLPKLAEKRTKLRKSSPVKEKPPSHTPTF